MASHSANKFNPHAIAFPVCHGASTQYKWWRPLVSSLSVVSHVGIATSTPNPISCMWFELFVHFLESACREARKWRLCQLDRDHDMENQPTTRNTHCRWSNVACTNFIRQCVFASHHHRIWRHDRHGGGNCGIGWFSVRSDHCHPASCDFGGVGTIHTWKWRTWYSSGRCMLSVGLLRTR